MLIVECNLLVEIHSLKNLTEFDKKNRIQILRNEDETDEKRELLSCTHVLGAVVKVFFFDGVFIAYICILDIISMFLLLLFVYFLICSNSLYQIILFFKKFLSLSFLCVVVLCIGMILNTQVVYLCFEKQ